MWFFTADEHYNHARIIEYCQRPFSSVLEMNEALIAAHNDVVRGGDVVVHCGDFGFFRRTSEAQAVLRRLNGSHILLKGSHDGWMPSSAKHMWRKTLSLPGGNKVLVTACHYAMRTWEKAHYGGVASTWAFARDPSSTGQAVGRRR